MKNEQTITLDQLVGREVFTNCSYLIQELSSNEKYQDEIGEFSYQPDYTASVEYFINTDVNKEQLGEIKEYIENFDLQNVNKGNMLDLISEHIGFDTFCEDFNLDPEYIEALEYWVVSDWLANKLEQHGELVTNDFYDLCVWGRACSGQSIKYDYVIQSIYNNLVK